MSLDVSFNALTGSIPSSGAPSLVCLVSFSFVFVGFLVLVPFLTLPTVFVQSFQLFQASGNPNFHGGTLPSWIKQDPTNFGKDITQSYLCPKLSWINGLFFVLR